MANRSGSSRPPPPPPPELLPPPELDPPPELLLEDGGGAVNVALTLPLADGGAPSQTISQVKVPVPATMMERVPDTGRMPAQLSPITPCEPRHIAARVVVQLIDTDCPDTRAV